MTLGEALRQHLGCDHEMSITRGDGVRALHNDSAVTVTAISSVAGEDTAAGSALFHDLARQLIGERGHTRTPMHITDEEYAGFVA